MFFGYVLGAKLNAVSLLRMRHKSMQLVLASPMATKLKVSINFYTRVSKVALGFFGVFWLRFGHEITFCFAVANASQNYAICAWQARWLQN